MKKLISFLALSFCALAVNAQATHNMKITFQDGNTVVFGMDSVKTVEFVEKEEHVTPAEPEVEDDTESNKTYTFEGIEYPMPEAIDLGLPSGTRWASMNIGAKNLYDVGQDFAWYPATHQDILGQGWKIPSREQALELHDNLSWNTIYDENNYPLRVEGTAANGNKIVFNIHLDDGWGDICVIRCWTTYTNNNLALFMASDFHYDENDVISVPGPYPGTSSDYHTLCKVRAVK